MKNHRSLCLASCALLSALCLLFSLSCGGGGAAGGGIFTPVYSAAFTPSAPPACSSCVSLSLDPASGNSLARLDVVVKGVSNIHDAAFDVRFDSTKLAFERYVAGPLLSKGVPPAAATFAAARDTGDPGVVTVGAAITDPAKEVSASASGEVLITLVFRVLSPGNSTLTFLSAGPLPFRAELKNKAGVVLSATWYGGFLTAFPQ